MQPQRFEVSVTPLDAKMASAPDAQIVFHGINKSGTTAMRAVLREAYVHAGRANEIYPRPNHRFENQQEMIAFADAHAGPALVIGHYLFGALQPRGDRRWVTILRHPLPRTISCYHWLKTHHAKADSFPSLEEFVEQGRGIAHSQVVQLGVGFGPGAAQRARELDLVEITERAKETIRRDVAVLGIAEHFEPSIFLFAHLAGLATVCPWRRDDRNKGRPPVDTLTDGQVALIRDVYRHDFELYYWGLEHFAKQLEAVRIGSSLAAYEDACRGAYRERGLG